MTASHSSDLLAELPRKGWDSDEILSWLQTERKICEQHRDPYVRLFLQAMRFWAGDQWRDIVESRLARWDSRRVRPIGIEEWRLVDNQIPIFCRHLLAVASQNMPRMEAVPVDHNDDEDLFAAQIGTGFLDWRERADKERMMREREWIWMLGVGECLRLTYYDAEGGDPIFGEGDIKTEIVDPFRYLKDPQSASEWPPRFIILSEARHVDWIKDNLGVKVDPENVADTMQYHDALTMNVMWGGRHQYRESMTGAAVVNQMLIPPGPKYPEGWSYVWVQNKLAKSHALQAGQWPLSRAGWYPMEGRLYPMGLIELMMPDQRRLNALQSLLYEAATKETRGDFVVAGPITDGRQVRQHVYNAKTGAKMTMLGPGVTNMYPMSWSSNWQHGQIEQDRLDRNLHQKSGVNQPALGQVLDKQARVGELLASREGDMMTSQWHIARFSEQHMAEVGRQKLRLAKEFYILPRKLEGIGSQKELVWFQGANLRDTRDVRLNAKPNMTPALRQQASQEAYGAGLLGPYISPSTGQPSILMQYAARKTLRSTGLDEIDDQLAGVYGPFEDLEKQAKALVEAQGQMEMQLTAAVAEAGPEALMAGAEQGGGGGAAQNA